MAVQFTPSQTALLRFYITADGYLHPVCCASLGSVTLLYKVSSVHISLRSPPPRKDMSVKADIVSE